MAQEKVEFPITGKITSVNISQGDVVCEINISVGQIVEIGDLLTIIEY